MKIEIKSVSGLVLYAAELPEDTPSGIAVRHALEKAVASGADLGGADLRGANLGGADLGDANLRGAYLDGADLGDANLRGAYLDGANLYGANLRGEVLTKAPVSILNLFWDVLITEQYMQIGCERYTHAEWAAFDDHAICAMDGKTALRFWRQWKATLLAMCAVHAAKDD